MVVKGRPRGNGKQLADYLLAMKDNDAIRILDLNGENQVEPSFLKIALHSMDMTSELTKSDKGLYHAQINPAPGEDLLMDDERWLEAADILGRQLGLENQRRAIVLHTKKERTHAHVVWERCDLEKGIMISDSFSRLAQDRARIEMEQVFGHAPTPYRNKHRPELKIAITNLWNKTKTGEQFVKLAGEYGYLISAGSGRTPFMIVDETARSHNLVRQIKGVRLKEVRDRLRNQKLATEKENIEFVRMVINTASGKGDKEKDTDQQARFKKVAKAYRVAKDDMLALPEESVRFQVKFETFEIAKDQITEAKEDKSDKTNKQLVQEFSENEDDIAPTLKEAPVPTSEKTKEQFAENAELTEKEDEERDPRIIAFRKRMEEMDRENERNKDKGYEIG